MARTWPLSSGSTLKRRGVNPSALTILRQIQDHDEAICWARVAVLPLGQVAACRLCDLYVMLVSVQRPVRCPILLVVVFLLLLQRRHRPSPHILLPPLRHPLHIRRAIRRAMTTTRRRGRFAWAAPAS
eukprot:7254824-Pyramimonas_sp.AAC.1